MGSGKKEYAVLLTNERSIFVLLFEKAISVGGFLGAGVGTAIAQGFLLLAAPDLSNFGNISQLIGAIPGAVVGALIARSGGEKAVLRLGTDGALRPRVGQEEHHRPARGPSASPA